MKPFDGFTDGGWDVDLPETVSGTEVVTYTYTYATRTTTPVEPINIVAYIVEHYKATEIGKYSDEADETEFFRGEVGSAVTATPKTYEGYAFDASVSVVEATLKAISSPEDIVVLKLYYDRDEVSSDGENGDEGDGTPDKYQKKVIFKVVNGTWADGTTADIVKYVDLKNADGEYDINGTASIIAPEGMIANYGYSVGAWDKAVTESVNGTEDETFTYTFSKVQYIVEHYKAIRQSVYNSYPDESVTLVGDINEVVEAAIKTYTGYAFNENISNTKAVLKEINSYEDMVILRLYYDIDKGGSDGDEGDGVPDIYQKKVIFKVVNGTWADGSTEDIVQVVNLMIGDKYNVNGTATVTIPKDMKADEGYKGGKWDREPTQTVKGTNEEVFTYTFNVVEYYVEHYKAVSEGKYADAPTDRETLTGEVGSTVTATPKSYEGYVYNSGISTVKATLKEYSGADSIVVLKLYYDIEPEAPVDPEEPENPDTPDNPVDPDTPVNPDVPAEPETPEGGGATDTKHYIVFGKTNSIGWYNVSLDGGETYQIVFGNSTLEVEEGTEMIIKAGDLVGGNFTFYVNGNAVKPDENNAIKLTVDGYMLIGAIGIDPDIDFEVPDTEESLNWFQKIIKAIKEFFEKLFGKR